MTHREMYDIVFEENADLPAFGKVKLLAQLIYRDRKDEDGFTKDDAVWVALEKYEEMCGRWIDPTHEQFDEIKCSIVG